MSNLLRGFAVGEFVVGKFLPVSQAGVNVVEDVEVSFSSAETQRLSPSKKLKRPRCILSLSAC